MFYCKDFFELSVLSLYEGDLIGVVDKLYFDKKLKKLCEIELISADGAKLILPTKNIYHVGKHAITVKNNQAVSLNRNFQDCCAAPINSKAYTISGEFLGLVQEISFNEKYLSEKIVLDNSSSIDIKNLATCGKNTIIFYNNETKVNVNNFVPNKQPKGFKDKEVVLANTLPVENVEHEVKVKSSTIQSTDFLLGRTCTKDIFNFNNEILIKAHSVINKKNLKEISKFGKLRELMLYSK